MPARWRRRPTACRHRRRDDLRRNTPVSTAAIEALSSCAYSVEGRTFPRGRRGRECCPDRGPDAGPFRLAYAPCAAGRPAALEDLRMKVSSASTISLKLRGLSSAGARRNRCRQRNAVVGWTPHSFAVFARLLPSIIAWRERATSPSCVDAPWAFCQGVERASATLAAELQQPVRAAPAYYLATRAMRQPRLSTRSTLVVPSASSVRLARRFPWAPPNLPARRPLSRLR